MLEKYLKLISEGFEKLDPKLAVSAVSKMYEKTYSCNFDKGHKLLADYSTAKLLQDKGFDTDFILKAIEAQIDYHRNDHFWVHVVEKFDIIKRNNEPFKK